MTVSHNCINPAIQKSRITTCKVIAAGNCFRLTRFLINSNKSKSRTKIVISKGNHNSHVEPLHPRHKNKIYEDSQVQ
jgi:hypothetical protein